jgi:hypothetical protein
MGAMKVIGGGIVVVVVAVWVGDVVGVVVVGWMRLCAGVGVGVAGTRVIVC